MDARFAEAWFNTDHRVLGRKLHPFCLEDALILSVANSPFMLGAEKHVEYELEDLQIAVQICSTPAEVFLKARFNQSWPTKIANFFWMSKWKRICSTEAGLRRQCQLFANYIDDFYTEPDLWQEDGGDSLNQMNAPWILGKVVFIMRHTHFGAREIWTMPIGQAMWIAGVLAEQVGYGVQIVSEEETEAMEAMGLK